MLIHRALASWQCVAALTVAGGLSLANPTHAVSAPDFETSDAVSDIPGVAHDTDAYVVNPWGLTTGPEGNLHVSDDQTGVSTLCAPSGLALGGTSTPDDEPHAITIPPAALSGTGATGTPTGIVINEKAILLTDTTDFVLTSGTRTGPARYIYATKDGAIAAYSRFVDQTSAIIPPTADLSATGAGFTGLALVEVSGTAAGSKPSPRLIAANFAQNKVNVFDGTFAPVALSGTESFTDPNPPAVPVAVSGSAVWSPFNVKDITFVGKAPGATKASVQQLVAVLYALHTGTTGLDEVDGPGYGYVNLFNVKGGFVQRLVDKDGLLNAPWGIAIAHRGIAKFRTPVTLVIGNHGDGQLNAYGFEPPASATPPVATHLGTLKNNEGTPLAIDGLWGLHFGPKKLSLAEQLLGLDSLDEDDHNLYFAAGLLDETHGLVGRISVP